MQYIKSVIGEFKNIRWLDFKSAIVLAIVVIIISLFVGFLIGFLDTGAQYLVETFIS